MFYVCQGCGQFRADKIIDPAGPWAICPECGHRHPFRHLPLIVVGGASGTGKSTLCLALVGAMPEAVLLESDALWRPEFDQPQTHYRDYFELWLRLAMNIGQAGRPVVLFGAGLGVPANLEPCVARRYFRTVHYLALVCEEGELAARLRRRPAWRGCDEAFVAEHLRFNRWYIEGPAVATPPIETLDTTGLTPAAAASALAVRLHGLLLLP